MSIFNGSSGDDSFSGGIGADTFNLADGGDDSASGGAGGDVFNLGAALSAGDRLDGGSGNDTLNLDGDYAAGLLLEAGTITGFEQLHLAAGHDYSLTFALGNVDFNGMTISGAAAGDSVSIDNSAAHPGSRLSVEVQGSVHFTGGGASEAIKIAAGAAQATASMGGGQDSVTLAGAFLSGYAFSSDPASESGLALLTIGNSAGRLNLTGAKASGFGVISLAGNNAYDVKIANDVVTPGQQLQVNIGSYADGSLVDAGKVSDGHVTFFSAEDCTMIGGRGDDAFHLQYGYEVVIGGGGSDYFDVTSGEVAIVYSRLAETTKAHADTVYLAGTATIDLSAVDADSTLAGDQAFSLVDHFDHQAGEICVAYKAKTNMTSITMDVDGDGKADGMILLYDYHADFHGFVL